MVKVYRNIATPVLFFGLEIMDLLFLAVLFIVVFNVSDHLFINVGLLVGMYLGIRFFKKGKPPGYTQHLIKFLMSEPDGHVQLEYKRGPRERH